MRELSQLLIELHEGLAAIEARAGVRLSGVDMSLPIVVRPVLHDGGCKLQAEFVRAADPEVWAPTPSRLRLAWNDSGTVDDEASIASAVAEGSP